jgi:uncharacterized membrane protein
MRFGPSILVKGALGASLALNLVLGGVLWWRPAQTPPGPGRMQARIERILPEPDREAFRQAMQAGRARYEPAQAALREGFSDMQAALRQQPFDADRLRAVMGESRARWGEFSRTYDDSLANGLAVISAEGRALIAHDMERGDRDGRRGGKSGRD